MGIQCLLHSEVQVVGVKASISQAVAVSFSVIDKDLFDLMQKAYIV